MWGHHHLAFALCLWNSKSWYDYLFLKRNLEGLVFLIKNSLEGNALLQCISPPRYGQYFTSFWFAMKWRNSTSGRRITRSFTHCSRRDAAFFALHEKHDKIENCPAPSCHRIPFHWSISSLSFLDGCNHLTDLTNKLDWIKELDLEVFLIDLFVLPQPPLIWK